jgi:plastocyanin
MTTKTLLAAAVTALALTGAAGCGGSSDATSDPAPTSQSSATQPTTASGPATSQPTGSSSTPVPGAAMITIQGFDFGDPVTVTPGAKVMVMNADPETHSVTADSGGAFDVTVEAGATTTFTAPTKPGSYAYHCTFHSDMHGTLTVK